MGLFTGKKTGADHTNNGNDDDNSQYILMNNGQALPVAVLVEPQPTSSTPGAQQVVYNNKMQVVPASTKQNNNTKHGHRTSGQQQQQQPPPVMLFVTRTPTILAQCPVCHKKNCRTRIVTAPDWMTWVTVAVLLVVFWPLCWVPLVTDSCRRTTHYCIACSAEIGSIRPFKDCFVKHR